MTDVRFPLSRTLRQLGAELTMGEGPISFDEVMGWVMRRMLEAAPRPQRPWMRAPGASEELEEAPLYQAP